jgi:hypothetical protein
MHFFIEDTCDLSLLLHRRITLWIFPDVMKLASRKGTSQVLCSATKRNLTSPPSLNTSLKTEIFGAASRTGHVSMLKSAFSDESTVGNHFGTKTNGPQEIGCISHVPYVGRLAPTPSGYMHGKSCRDKRWSSLLNDMAIGNIDRVEFFNCNKFESIDSNNFKKRFDSSTRSS